MTGLNTAESAEICETKSSTAELNVTKLSVIVPLYNVEAYAPRGMESIKSQVAEGLEGKLEIVLVDDGSTDRSLEVCLEHLRPLEHLSNVDIITIRQENSGLSVARNEGIFAATGDYIMFLDSDDFLLPNAFSNILVILKSDKPDVLFGRYLRWSLHTGFLYSKPYKYQPPEDPKKRTEYIISALPEPSWNAWRYICNRKVILERELFFERGILCEDVPWSLTLLENVDSVAFLQEPFYAYYQRRPDSIMNQMDPKRLVDLNCIVKTLLEQYKDRPVIFRRLVWQSFFYVNEYCAFNKDERELIWKSYKSVLPLYKLSKSRLHRIVGRSQNQVLFYMISLGMFLVKFARRGWKYGMGSVKEGEKYKEHEEKVNVSTRR